jgi:DNA recombination protein RmuC
MTVEVFLVVAIIVLALGNAVLLYFVLKKDTPREDTTGLLLQQQIQDLARAMDTKLTENSNHMHRSVETQLGESAKLIREVTTGLTKLDDTNKQVVSFAEELKQLQDILKNPKQRGVLGEYYLESVLRNVLPPNRYKMQYKFSDGEIVDAVIFLDKNKILPIDSKFSLENYNRLVAANDPAERERLEKIFKQDIKNRIDETSKYIRPGEDTMDFAFMFIPSEGVYYDLLVNQVGTVKASARDLIEYAFRDKKVIIVSPTSFLAYLQTVMQGLRALEIEESAKEIRKRVIELDRHLNVYHDYFLKLGNSISTTVNHYNSAGKELRKVDKDIMRVTGSSSGLDPAPVDRPALEDN